MPASDQRERGLGPWLRPLPPCVRIARGLRRADDAVIQASLLRHLHTTMRLEMGKRSNNEELIGMTAEAEIDIGFLTPLTA